MKYFAHSNGHDYEIQLTPDRDRMKVRVGREELDVAMDDQKASIRTAFIGKKRLEFGWERRGNTYVILIEGIEYEILVRDPKSELLAKVSESVEAKTGAVEVRAPIPGLITKALVAVGSAVRKDQPVVCLDAMKLENEIPAPRDGVVKSLAVQPGQPVEKGQVLFIIA